MTRPPARAGGRTGGRDANLAWSVLFVVAAVVGGLAAADLTRESTVVAVLFSLLVAAIMVIALYRGMFDQARPEVESQAGQPRGAHRAEQGPPRQSAEPGAAQPGLVQPGPVQPGAVQLVQPQAGGSWWEGRAPAGAAQRPAPAAGRRPVPLSHFLDQALIAQCPKCGAFAVDVDNRAAEWLFSCQECRQRWTWQPGRPWPAVNVRPEARRRMDRPRG
jgi:hypothetical protein